MEYSKKALLNITRAEFYIDQIISQQWSLFGRQINISERNFLNVLLPFEIFKTYYRLKSYFQQKGLIYNSSQIEDNKMDVVIDKER